MWLGCVAVCYLLMNTGLGAAYYMIITIVLGALAYYLVGYKYNKAA